MPLNALSPDRLQQLLVEVAQEEADRYKAALEDALNEGWLLWSMNSDAARMKGYMANTIMEDLPLVLEPAYLDLYKQGMAPDLAALTLWNQVQQQAMMTGQPITDTSKLLWAMLLDLPSWVWKKFQQDFISLSRQFLKQMA